MIYIYERNDIFIAKYIYTFIRPCHFYKPIYRGGYPFKKYWAPLNLFPTYRAANFVYIYIIVIIPMASEDIAIFEISEHPSFYYIFSHCFVFFIFRLISLLVHPSLSTDFFSFIIYTNPT